MTDFQTLLRDLITHYGGTKQDLARAIRVTPATVSHFLAGDAVPNTDVCLRLATVTEVSASKVLRAAGKGWIADLLEDLYGAAALRRPTWIGLRLTPQEQRTMIALRKLTPKAQRAFAAILEDVSLPFRNPAVSFPRVRPAARGTLTPKRRATQSREEKII